MKKRQLWSGKELFAKIPVWHQKIGTESNFSLRNALIILFRRFVEITLNDYVFYSLLDDFKKYIDKCETELNNMQNLAEQQQLFGHMKIFGGIFCQTLFQNPVSDPEAIWQYFPPEWKISMENSRRQMPWIVLHNFILWSQNHIFLENDDQHLSDVIDNIFPDTEAVQLLPAFFMLFFSGFETKIAVHKIPNFQAIRPIFYNTQENKEIFKEESKRFEDLTEKTIKMIMHFFLSPSYMEKLKTVKNEITGEEVKRICQTDAEKEMWRGHIERLVDLLLKEMESRPQNPS